jgi:uncharacterized protein HemX
MSELHPDADLVKVTRTTTTYERAAPHTTRDARRRDGGLPWVMGLIVVVAILAGVFWYYGRGGPDSAQREIATAAQVHAQALSQQAQNRTEVAQQSADRSRAQLDAGAANDLADAKREAAQDDPAANDAGPATN